MNKLITVLTPTYNRGYKIRDLYDSLIKQTSKNFKWMIIDDGSTDDTKYICKEFIEEEKIDISYHCKVNGGKHTALNVGIEKIDTELTIIVDSDDWLLSDAIDTIEDIHQKYTGNDELSGYAFLRCKEDGKVIVNNQRNEFVANYIKYRIKGNLPGDMAEVFKTDIIKKFPFPEFKDERFLSEDVVWIKMGLEYNFLFTNLPIYVCEYLKDGLTSNDKPMKFKSPKGSVLRGKMLMIPECGLKWNVKGAIIYNCYFSIFCYWFSHRRYSHFFL